MSFSPRMGPKPASQCLLHQLTHGYGLVMKYPPPAPVLNAWSPDGGTILDLGNRFNFGGVWPCWRKWDTGGMYVITIPPPSLTTLSPVSHSLSLSPLPECHEGNMFLLHTAPDTQEQEAKQLWAKISRTVSNASLSFSELISGACVTATQKQWMWC